MKKIAFFVSTLLLCGSLNAAIVTNFGSSSFTVTGPNLGTFSQTSSSLTVNLPPVGGLLIGDLVTPFNAAGFTGFSVSGNLLQTSDAIVTFVIYNSTFDSTSNYTLNLNTRPTGSFSAVLTQTTPMNFTVIGGMDIQVSAGPTSNPFNAELTALTAIPEPSTYAAILGGLALIFLVRRRMRKA
jgi:hypothetical protein